MGETDRFKAFGRKRGRNDLPFFILLKISKFSDYIDYFFINF